MQRTSRYVGASSICKLLMNRTLESEIIHSQE
jgi:hypothetical protein